ncbi:ficolin-2-like [Acanthaster planci]|uniref:Ficolin-2-like n=1 Tax=Acanthaster planci TaxID=133434 RepID=A0A8B7YW11_ACAPL|nr:ficolin-2-like [Acanthaster planci]XP_022097503.1 ficolin-2-like [Acanthaster planci]
MTRVHQVVVLAFIVFGIFTTATVSDSLTYKKGAQPVYQQQIIINSLDELSYPRATFDFTKVGEIVADELQNTTRWLAQMETNIAGKVHALSAELYAVKMQLDQITESVKELVELLKNTTVTPPTSPVTPPTPFKDCSEAFASGVTTSGVYTVKPLDNEGPFRVYCDMETDGGGWTVFQRRQDGSVDFYRDWESYRQGFGSLDGEFWLGNDNLHRLTAQGAYRLRVDLEDFEGNTAYAKYDTFRVADGSDDYRLTVGGYSGTASDSFSVHSNYPFTTKDRNNESNSHNCAVRYTGAWWYCSCHDTNLNGLYLRGQTDQYAKGVVWQHWKGDYYSLKRTEMKIKLATR